MVAFRSHVIFQSFESAIDEFVDQIFISDGSDIVAA